MRSAIEEPHNAGLGKKHLKESQGSGSATEHICEKSTALNTHAVCSEDGSGEDAPFELLENFEWRGITWPEKDILNLTVTQWGKEIKL